MSKRTVFIWESVLQSIRLNTSANEIGIRFHKSASSILARPLLSTRTELLAPSLVQTFANICDASILGLHITNSIEIIRSESSGVLWDSWRRTHKNCLLDSTNIRLIFPLSQRLFQCHGFSHFCALVAAIRLSRNQGSLCVLFWKRS